jgi:hypothetical protein
MFVPRIVSLDKLSIPTQLHRDVIGTILGIATIKTINI